MKIPTAREIEVLTLALNAKQKLYAPPDHAEVYADLLAIVCDPADARKVADELKDTNDRAGDVIITRPFTPEEVRRAFVRVNDDAQYSFGEAVADLAANFAHAEFTPEDSRDFTRICIHWAREFEQKNAGREWDGEYIEEIDAFFAENYSAWLNSGARTRPNPMK